MSINLSNSVSLSVSVLTVYTINTIITKLCMVKQQLMQSVGTWTVRLCTQNSRYLGSMAHVQTKCACMDNKISSDLPHRAHVHSK